LTEIEMFPLVKLWLENRGFKVYGEVRYRRHDIDVVGDKVGQQVCVELKQNFTKRLKQQLMICKRATAYVYSCTGSTPQKSNLEWCVQHGIGVIIIDKKLRVVLEPVSKKKRYTWINLKHCPQGNLGGAPCGKDKHPAKDVHTALLALIESNPSIDWNNAYNQIPNHYAHAKSMEMSMKRYCEFQYLPLLLIRGHGSRPSRKRRFKRLTR